MNNDEIRELAYRFCCWRLPEYFRPDCYVTFDYKLAKKNNSWPTGTNLLTVDQAEEMLRHLLADGIESHAANLVSDAKQKLIDGIMAQREEVLRAFVAKYGAEPDEVVQVCKGERWWIERHATPQTQATHGEGEAVRYRDTLVDIANIASDHGMAWLVNKIGSVLTGANQSPLPTVPPTAALAKALSKIVREYEKYPDSYLETTDIDTIREAAAALSGVAAQGDNHV